MFFYIPAPRVVFFYVTRVVVVVLGCLKKNKSGGVRGDGDTRSCVCVGCGVGVVCVVGLVWGCPPPFSWVVPFLGRFCLTCYWGVCCVC